MTKIAGHLMRNATPQEHTPLLKDLTGTGFLLRNTHIKRLRSTNAAVHLFDVIGPQGNRLGVANLVVEPSVDAIRDFGHVCVTLAEDNSNSQLLTDAAQLLFDTAYKLGLKEIRVVSPKDHADSVCACEALNPDTTAEPLNRDGKSFLSYRYCKR